MLSTVPDKTELPFCRSLAVTALFVLTACAEPDGDEAQAPLLLTLASPPTTLIQGIGDAENATFTSDGRLFVTGGESVYEITKVGDVYQAQRLYEDACNFTGIVEHAGYLYTTCAQGTDLASLTPYLLAAPLAARVEFEIIHEFTKVGIPNGIAFDQLGRLFVTDFTPLLGKLVTISFAPSSPLSVTREEVWHSMNHPLANGLKIHDNKVYLTDLGELKVIPIAADGSAGRVSVIASRLAVFDDLLVSDTEIIVGDFYGGKLVHYSHAGRLLKQTDALFRSPSSITAARGPLAPPGSFVVTEKGALGELTSSDGNRVSLYVP